MVVNWDEMENGEVYTVTVKGMARTWKVEGEADGVSLYRLSENKGPLEMLLGYQQLLDPETTLKIEKVD